MSEEKLYVVEDDNRLHLAFNDAGKPMWFQTDGNFTATDSVASMWSLRHGGHVVTLVEEPEKVVLSKEQAQIVEDAHGYMWPAKYIADNTDGGYESERLLMDAFVNGYTVAKEKKYLLPMDGTLEENDDNDNFQLYAYCYKGRWLADEVETYPSYKHHTATTLPTALDFRTVTQKELETAPAWVKAIKPLEVTDDEEV